MDTLSVLDPPRPVDEIDDLHRAVESHDPGLAAFAVWALIDRIRSMPDTLQPVLRWEVAPRVVCLARKPGVDRNLVAELAADLSADLAADAAHAWLRCEVEPTTEQLATIAELDAVAISPGRAGTCRSAAR